MLKYLIIQLDDSSVSFCHYPSSDNKKLISLENLREGILWAMKENLMVQFVYPDYDLPQEYLDLIDTVDHIDMTPGFSDSDVAVFDNPEPLAETDDETDTQIVLRLSKNDFFEKTDLIKDIIKKHNSVNLVISDIETFSSEDFETYKQKLAELSSLLEQKILSGSQTSLNLLTDRLALEKMNNCNAGDESITLAPDGKFYICPAFYYDREDAIGNPFDGLDIPNDQLYKLHFAPICRNCDAYQCRRCIWLNKKTTYEVNTPSHEQCVVAHLERNTSRELLERLKSSGKIRIQKSIPEIDYLDPFEKVKK